MNYFARTIWDKRLPAYSGILVLLVVLGLTIMLSSNTAQFATRATVGSVPKNVQISNITPTSFTVSYTTDELALGTLAYGQQPTLGSVAVDVRDQQTGDTSEHRVHYFTVQNLQPATRYYFSITSGAQVATDNGNPFEVITAIPGSTPPANPTVSGSVALDDGSFPTEGVVYVSTETSQLISALIQPDGRFSIPMNELRTKDLTTYLPLIGNTKVQLQITNGTLQSSAEVLATEASDIPKIVLSKDYNYTLDTGALDASASAQPASESAEFPMFDEPVGVTAPEITVPEENQQFRDTQPLFKGKALPNTAIQLVVQAEKEVEVSLTSDENGYWEFRPPVELEPGNSSITISSVDINGTLQKLSRSFVVNAQGSQFVEPSVSPIDASPTTAPPITPTVASLPSPTFEPSPTATPSPTIEPTQVIPTGPSPTRGPLAQTGSYDTIAGIAMSVLFLASGVILFFSIAV